MSAPVIKGDTVLIGFPSGETVSGLIRDTYDKETTADIEHVRNEDNEEASAIVSNPGLRIIIDGVCSSAQTVAKGDLLTINSVVYLVESATNRHSRLATRFSATVYKPDGATYTA